MWCALVNSDADVDGWWRAVDVNASILHHARLSCVSLSLAKVWKGEAFRLWVDLWASLYDDESKSAELLHEVHDTYYLVAVVDNNFIDGNLWEVCVCVCVCVCVFCR